MEFNRDAFYAGAWECVLWANTYTYDEEQDEITACSDLHSLGIEPTDILTSEDVVAFYSRCDEFIRAYAEDLLKSGIDPSRAGFCYAISCNGHGSGFFDEHSISESYRESLQRAASLDGNLTLDVSLDDDGGITSAYWGEI